MIPKRKGLTRLSIFHKQVRQNRITNKFYSKALCYKVRFPNVKFNNINFKGAILTYCSFKDASFTNVEFLGTNLKKSNFTGAVFKHCLFSAALLKGTNFKNCVFEDCLFVSTNLNTAKNLHLSDNNDFLTTHIMPDIDSALIELFNKFRFHEKLQNTRVLHLKKGKLNSLTVYMIIKRLGADKCKRGLENLNSHLSMRIVTANQLCNLIDRASND